MLSHHIMVYLLENLEVPHDLIIYK
jgi:hypothetical protein